MVCRRESGAAGTDVGGVKFSDPNSPPFSTSSPDPMATEEDHVVTGWSPEGSGEGPRSKSSPPCPSRSLDLPTSAGPSLPAQHSESTPVCGISGPGNWWQSITSPSSVLAGAPRRSIGPNQPRGFESTPLPRLSPHARMTKGFPFVFSSCVAAHERDASAGVRSGCAAFCTEPCCLTRA